MMGKIPVVISVLLLTAIATAAMGEAGKESVQAHGIVPFEFASADVKLRSAAMTALIANLHGPQDARLLSEIHSVLVYQHGALTLEEYFTGNDDVIDFEAGVKRISGGPVQWSADRLHYVASVNKGITSLLTGIALAQSHLTVDTKALALLPCSRDYQAASWAKSLTLRHLLTMQSGFVWDEWSGQDLALLWQSRDFTETLLARDNLGPGVEWRYNSAAPNLLLNLLQTTLDEPIRAWAENVFFKPLGIKHYRWDSQPNGAPEGAARLYLRPRDMLKIGVMILQGGQWQGRQVVPHAWMEQATQVQVKTPSGDYGYYFWLREINGIRYISLDGDGGQYINIFPEENTVVVMTQGNYLQWPLYADQANLLMRDYIFVE